MRVVSFNIQHGRSRRGSVDAPLAARVCARLAPDVLGLQEVDRGVPRSAGVDQPAAIAAETGMAVAFAPAFDLDGGEYGNALLVRGALDEVEVTVLPAGSAGLEPRSLLLARAELDDPASSVRAVSVAVTHLSTHGPTAMRQLLAVLEALWQRPPPRLLLGDFNLRPEHVHPALQVGRMSVSARLPTFPARRPDRAIDYVAASGLTVVDTRAEPTEISDHCALVCEVG